MAVGGIPQTPLEGAHDTGKRSYRNPGSTPVMIISSFSIVSPKTWDE